MAFMFPRFFFILITVTLFYSGLVCNGSDTLLPGQSLFPNQTLFSKGGKFELGFFRRGNSSDYCIGIWYKNIPVRTVVWAFNRFEYHTQVTQLQLSSSGSLVFHFGEDLWMYAKFSNVSEAVILDTGNFVLRNGSSGILWQSFDEPAETWLPGMKLYNDSFGLVSRVYYSLNVDSRSREVYTQFNRSEILWRSGSLQGGSFASLPDRSSFSKFYNFTYLSSKYWRREYFIYNVYNESVALRMVIDYEGRLMHFGWSEARRDWNVLSCSTYPLCWPNTICNVNYSPVCRCLDGFVPRFKREWDIADFSNGCERTRPLECGQGKTRFIKVPTTRLPANTQSRKLAKDVCELVCSGDCSCTAFYYAYDNGDCLLFMGDVPALDSSPNNSLVVDLYIKTESTDAATATGIGFVLAVIIPITAALLISCFCFFCLWPKLKNKETHQDLLELDFNSNGLANERHDSVGMVDRGVYTFPIFSFSSIAASTNNFSITNKLGEGGFGPVYKGELLNGQFVAVKRLSRRSGQGLEEFKNEIELIAKLQHRNLVRILGCCNENDEMILIYEYMPNQSLDIFLFEQTKKDLLDWKRRVHIISGIAHGLLYLHIYSRLRIVHRDLKASNILLDAEMNPKISDFGMARIFGGNDLQANTKRIVGTYGYMSPEYAMEGHFSVKSDVYAFGVLMLEIISGKKNIGFHGYDSLSLLRYAWNLWKNDSAHELVDPMLEISDSSSSILALRYIQISLLCIEENPAERPLISDVIGMLSNERKPIASPKNPVSTVGRSLAKAAPTQHKVEICSVNDLTLSNVEAR